MAEIRPLRAWRYNRQVVPNIEDITSPLFDVVSPKQREMLYQEKLSSIHLSVPRGDSPAASAKETLERWKKEEIIFQDPLPGIYVYYQHFTLPGSQKEYVRKGFICNIRAYDWDEEVLLRHENTMPHSVNDRIALLESTELNVSPTHGLYTDEGFSLEGFMDESMKNPIYETEDYQGVRDVLSVIHDKDIIDQFVKTVKDKQIILADGHHRYESSLLYRKKSIKENPEHTGQEGYNFHLMYLTNTEADDLRILPTHRLIDGLKELDPDVILKKLEPYFIIKPVPDAYMVNEIILGKPWAFGLVFKDRTYKVRLKGPEYLKEINWKFPEVIKRTGSHGDALFYYRKSAWHPRQRASYQLSHFFDRNFSDCLAKVIQNEAQLAIITNEIAMEDVKQVCYTGYTLPQKSTYFYPKVICGFLFSSIAENEFALPINPGF